MYIIWKIVSLPFDNNMLKNFSHTFRSCYKCIQVLCDISFKFILTWHRHCAVSCDKWQPKVLWRLWCQTCDGRIEWRWYRMTYRTHVNDIPVAIEILSLTIAGVSSWLGYRIWQPGNIQYCRQRNNVMVILLWMHSGTVPYLIRAHTHETSPLHGLTWQVTSKGALTSLLPDPWRMHIKTAV